MQLKLNQNLLSWLVKHQSPTRSTQSLDFIFRLQKKLKFMGFDVTTDAHFNIYATKLTNPKDHLYFPCFVAHTDTAQPLHKKIELVESEGVLFGWDGEKQVGAGFDDKVGICIALQLAEQLDNVKLFFPADEESGCIGSAAADMEFFKDVSFCAQPDRRGSSDFIYYTNGIQVASDEFCESMVGLLDSHGYHLTEGTCTDIGELVHQGIGICCFNISVGYHHEHTNKEILDVAAAEKCLNFLLTATRFLAGKRWEHKPSFHDPYKNNDDEFTRMLEHEQLVDLTADLLYELDFTPNLPNKVKRIIDKLNNLLYGYSNTASVSSFSEWDDSFSNHNRWIDMEM